MEETVIKSLKELTSKGGQLFFDKSIMYEWMKDRFVDINQIEDIDLFSLKFLPIDDNRANSFIEIYGDMGYFTDCTDYKIISMILQEKPILKYHYEENDIVAFFDIRFNQVNNIIITCDSLDDRPFWFPNAELSEVIKIFEKPLRVTY